MILQKLFICLSACLFGRKHKTLKYKLKKTSGKTFSKHISYFNASQYIKVRLTHPDNVDGSGITPAHIQVRPTLASTLHSSHQQTVSLQQLYVDKWERIVSTCLHLHSCKQGSDWWPCVQENAVFLKKKSQKSNLRYSEWLDKTACLQESSMGLVECALLWQMLQHDFLERERKTSLTPGIKCRYMTEI